MGHVVASVPQFVLGGAGIVMFGMVAATGIKILASVDFVRYTASPHIIAISIGFGMIPLVSDQFSIRCRRRCSRSCTPASCWPRSRPCC